MAQAYDFIQKTRGISRSDTWLMVGAFRAETFPNQLEREGTSVVVLFPDRSSVYMHDLDASAPRVVARS